MVVSVACQAREVQCRRVPDGASADIQPGELEIRRQPGRSLAVIVMMVRTSIGPIVGIGLDGRTVIVCMRVHIGRLLACTMIMVGLVIDLKRSGPGIGYVRVTKLVLDDPDGDRRRLQGQKQHQSRAKHGDSSRKAGPCARRHAPLP